MLGPGEIVQSARLKVTPGRDGIQASSQVHGCPKFRDFNIDERLAAKKKLGLSYSVLILKIKHSFIIKTFVNVYFCLL